MAYKQVKQFYKTTRWQKKRKVVLKKYGYMCAESKRYGDGKQAELIHHIYPLEEYPELAYETWNLLPLTSARHNRFHDRNNNKVIGRGLYWQEQRKKEFEEFYSKRKKPTI